MVTPIETINDQAAQQPASFDSDSQETKVETLSDYALPESNNALSSRSTAYDVVNVSPEGAMTAGAQVYGDDGVFIGNDDGVFKMSIISSSGSLKYDGVNLTINDLSLNFQDVFGDGSDGDVTISGSTSLTRDMYYDNLTVEAAGNLNPNGFRIFVKGTLTNEGTIARNGNAGGNGGNAGPIYSGTGGTAGAALASGSVQGSIAGKAGTAGGGGAGTMGDSVAKSLGADGVAGGFGNDPGNPAPQGGAAGSKTGTIYNSISNFTAAYLMYDFYPTPDYLRSSAGSGSGAGGKGWGGRGGGGGGSGSPGGIIFLAAKNVVNNGTISLIGGNGGNGGDGAVDGTYPPNEFAGGGGGGGGGSGGVLVYINSASSGSGTISVAGGTGGTGGTGYLKNSSNPPTPNYYGGDGEDGNSGTLIQLQV